MTSSDYIGLVTVRTSSTRLPNKCLLPFGQGNVISHVVKRAISYGMRPIICTSVDPSDDILENMARELNVECFRGSMKNNCHLRRVLRVLDIELANKASPLVNEASPLVEEASPLTDEASPHTDP